MAAAIARANSDACILAWPLSLERCPTLRAVRPGQHTTVPIENRGSATGGARLKRRGAPLAALPITRKHANISGRGTNLHMTFLPPQGEGGWGVRLPTTRRGQNER